jgi:hypothetical protein
LFEALLEAGTDMKPTFFLIVLLSSLAGCNPTVKIEAPDKPIEINLNVKIEHEIRLQIDKELEGLFDEDSDVF